MQKKQNVQNLREAATFLLAGGALAYPTETFYGLGCAALERAGLDQLATWKPRDVGAKPYPLIVGDVTQLALVVTRVPPLAEVLMAQFWPGPLTLVLPARSDLDPRICGAGGGVAVRVSPHPIAAALALAVGQPLVSTSANPAGQPASTTAAEVAAAFAPRVLPILDGGTCAGGAPSTIVSLLDDAPQILRAGAIEEATLLPWLRPGKNAL